MEAGACLRKERSTHHPLPSSRSSHQSKRTNPDFGGSSSSGGSRPGAVVRRAGHAQHGNEEDPHWFCVLTPSSSRSHKQLGTAYSTGCPLTRLPKWITAFAPPSSAPYLPHRHPGAEKRVSVSNPWWAPSSRWAGRGKTVAPKRHSTTSTNWAAPSPPCSSSPRVTLPLPPLPLCLEAKF